MALTTTISRNELARIAALAYEGETLVVMLCNVEASGFTAESTVAQWQGQELAEVNGYEPVSAVIAAGSYDVTDGRHEMPVISAEFTSTGDGYAFDRVVVYVDGATNVHSVWEEDPNVVISSGQTMTYQVQPFVDEMPV